MMFALNDLAFAYLCIIYKVNFKSVDKVYVFTGLSDTKSDIEKRKCEFLKTRKTFDSVLMCHFIMVFTRT